MGQVDLKTSRIPAVFKCYMAVTVTGGKTSKNRCIMIENSSHNMRKRYHNSRKICNKDQNSWLQQMLNHVIKTQIYLSRATDSRNYMQPRNFMDPRKTVIPAILRRLLVRSYVQILYFFHILCRKSKLKKKKQLHIFFKTVKLFIIQ